MQLTIEFQIKTLTNLNFKISIKKINFNSTKLCKYLNNIITYSFFIKLTTFFVKFF